MFVNCSCLWTCWSFLRRWSVKTLFLKISQNSQENRSKSATLSKKRLRYMCLFSCKFCEISKNTFFISGGCLFFYSNCLSKIVFQKFLEIQLSSWNFDSNLMFHAANVSWCTYLKGAPESCFTHYLCVFIILFSTSLYKSAFFLPILMEN